METLEIHDALAELGRRIRDSDHRAFAELFDALHEPLLRYAWRLVADDAAARDVVQQAFIRLWQGRDRIDDHRSIKALLYTSVRNLALNHIRDEQRRRALLSEAFPADEEHVSEDADGLDAETLNRHIASWITEMPARRREAFVLSRFDRLNHDEIARVMDLAPNTVNTHIMLALRHLRKRLAAFELE